MSELDKEKIEIKEAKPELIAGDIPATSNSLANAKQSGNTKKNKSNKKSTKQTKIGIPAILALIIICSIINLFFSAQFRELHSSIIVAITKNLGVVDPRYNESLVDLAKAYIRNNKIDQAEKIYQQMLIALPEKNNIPDSHLWDLQLAIANFYYDKDDFQKAALSYGDALNMLNKTPTQYLDRKYTGLWPLAYSEKEIKQFDKAADHFKEAIVIEEKINPKNLGGLAWIYFQLGDVYRQQNKFAEAISTLKHSLELGGDERGYTLISLGKAYLGSGNFAESENAFRQAIAIQQKKWPNDSTVLFTRHKLANAYRDSGHLQDAIKEYQEILNIWKVFDFGTDYDLYDDYAKALMMMHEPEMAQGVLEEGKKNRANAKANGYLK
jgi:tetratricopeptide (TPR) repeat protein